MKRIGKNTQGVLFALVLLLSLSIGMIVARETAAVGLAPMVTGVLTRVDQEQAILFVKLTGEAEVALHWNKGSAFFLNSKAVLADAFTQKALGKRVEIVYSLAENDKKIVSNARILP